MENKEHMLGCLLGGAVGDSLGLPAEGLSRHRLKRLWQSEWKHRLVFGKGMFSDDTEHALMTASALLNSDGDSIDFQHCLAWKLRWWLTALPAGIGMATAKAIIRLWLGFSPNRAGVLSAGNGPTMRSAPIGVRFHENAILRREYTLASCRLTHRDPRAEESSILVAEAASLAVNDIDNEASVKALKQFVSSNEMLSRFAKLEVALARKDQVSDFAVSIGCKDGVSGFAPDTVSVVIYAWLRHRGDFRMTMTTALNCGGDVDSVGAVLGGIAGAECGESGIPQEWLADICDWPRSINYVRKLANKMTDETASEPSLFWPVIPLRNFVFLIIVLCHGFRRLLPPY